MEQTATDNTSFKLWLFSIKVVFRKIAFRRQRERATTYTGDVASSSLIRRPVGRSGRIWHHHTQRRRLARLYLLQ